ncbi:hypothetical protein Tco_1186884 [Tanacetum coccineum]
MVTIRTLLRSHLSLRNKGPHLVTSGSVFKHSGATTFVPAAVYGVVALNRAWTLELIWFSGDVLSRFSSTPSVKAWLRKTVERPVTLVRCQLPSFHDVQGLIQ